MSEEKEPLDPGFKFLKFFLGIAVVVALVKFLESGGDFSVTGEALVAGVCIVLVIWVVTLFFNKTGLEDKTDERSGVLGGFIRLAFIVIPIGIVLVILDACSK